MKSELKEIVESMMYKHALIQPCIHTNVQFLLLRFDEKIVKYIIVRLS
jgi:hypothetical protein